MNASYGRNLDLNLLRVFVVVAEAGSVTAAASKLYLTQPAISAALRRLTQAVGAPLFARQGRGVALTTRGERLLAQAQPHLASLVDAALAPADFDPLTSERTFRIGLSDVTEALLVPALLRVFEREAPRMRLIILPVQFRTVGEALVARRIAHEHLIVSYNRDLRGIVEDTLRKTRSVRCSVPSFANIGALISGTSLLATVPEEVAAHVRRAFPHLATAEKPFVLEGSPMELLWLATSDDDPATGYLRGVIERVSLKPSTRPSSAVRPGGRAATRGRRRAT